MSDYKDDNDNKFDSAFRTKALFLVLLGVACIVGAILGLHLLTGTVK